MTENQLEVVNTQDSSPAELIKAAVEGGADLDKLEKLLVLQERWEANQAKKAYNNAMAQFKANPPEINKDRKVDYSTQKGNVSYSHASLANVVNKITKELSKYGLSASWRTQQNGNVIVTCRISHELGHYEETSLSAPSDQTGSKNVIQAIGSTITYLERYSLLALAGLATFDQDNDAASVNKPSVEMPKAKGEVSAVNDTGVVTGAPTPIATITQKEWDALLELATNNGYSVDDVGNWCNSLRYTAKRKFTNLNELDYEDAVAKFSIPKEGEDD